MTPTDSLEFRAFLIDTHGSAGPPTPFTRRGLCACCLAADAIRDSHPYERVRLGAGFFFTSAFDRTLPGLGPTWAAAFSGWPQ